MPSAAEMDPFDQMVDRLKALGHPVRLAILRRIVQGPESGTAAGEIQEHVGIPASTLSHHLACLSEAGLVQVEREGTFLHYRANFHALRALTDYLWKDCCAGGTQVEARPKACCGVKVRKTARN